MAEKEFNPSEHLLDLRGKQYLPVAWRIYWLRDKHPDALLSTTMLEHSESHAIFMAQVSIPNGGTATGYGSETQDDFGDFLEKAETKAIGRALAALGFGTQFCDDFEEGGSVTDAPIQRKGPVKSYEEQRKPAASQEPGQSRNALRKALTKKFGPDEKAAFDFMESVEPGAIDGTGIDFSVITPDRCKEIIAIVGEPA
jgi:flavodoxin